MEELAAQQDANQRAAFAAAQAERLAQEEETALRQLQDQTLGHQRNAVRVPRKQRKGGSRLERCACRGLPGEMVLKPRNQEPRIFSDLLRRRAITSGNCFGEGYLVGCLHCLKVTLE